MPQRELCGARPLQRARAKNPHHGAAIPQPLPPPAIVLNRLLILWHYCRYRYGWRPRTPAQLHRWQQRQLRQCARRAARTFAFYRPLAATPFRQWPVVDKAGYLAHFAGLNAFGLPLAACRAFAQAAETSRDFAAQLPRGLSVGLSSGTAGPQGVFLVSARERRAWAGAMLAKALPGSIFRPARMALFLRANNALYETLGSGRLRFAYFDLSRALPELLQELRAFRPTVLVAPAYVLRLLAEAELREPLGIAPARIYSAAEVLEAEDQAVIECAFGQPVHQIYQAAEGFLGISCAHGRLHLNEDLLYFEKEYLDEASGRFTPIITDFRRSAQAIIRYRLNDVLIAARTSCPCGSPFVAIERIEGRCDDVLALPAATDGRLVPVFPDFIRSAVLQSSPRISDFRCVQDAPAAVTLLLETPGAAPADQAEIHRQAAAALGALWARLAVCPPQLTLAALAPVAAPDLRRKRRRVQRAFPVELAALAR